MVQLEWDKLQESQLGSSRRPWSKPQDSGRDKDQLPFAQVSIPRLQLCRGTDEGGDVRKGVSRGLASTLASWDLG